MRRLVTGTALCLLVAASLLLLLQRRRTSFRVSGHADAIAVDGARRTYWLYVPPNFRSGALLIVLHGSGATGRQMAERTGLNATAADHGFAVVYPDALVAPGAGLAEWNGYFSSGIFHNHPPDDVAFVRALISKLQDEIAFDPNRVYVVGGSNGGLMANRLGIELADKIAAIGIVSGSLYAFGANATALPRPVQPLSVIMLHGDSDDLVPYRAGPAVATQERSFAFWSDAGHCNRVEPALPLCSPQGTITSVSVKSAADCDAGVEVQFYRLIGGVHSWYRRPMNVPGSTPYNPQLNEQTGTNTNEILWTFFARHSKSARN